MRLIDADELIKNFEDYANDKDSLAVYGKILPVILGDCIIEIKKQPTVYDVDKVIGELERNSMPFMGDSDDRDVDLNKAIKIVKAGMGG